MYKKYVKRIIDLVLSSIGILLAALPMCVVALIIFIEDPGPVFFSQKRVGIHKTHFKLLKFRSMKMSTPHDTPTHLLENPDQYILRSGRILRKYSIDEIPQFFNIFMGDMSIIGPRPALWNQFDLIEERDKYGANDVKPGLTGWAQINGRDELAIPVKARLDGEYVAKLSFLFDCKCFFKTILSVISHDGVVEGKTKSLETEREEESKALENDATVSIVMPAYNAQEFIEKTINSVQDQTVTDWKLVIADDCSTDNTVAIVEKIAQKDSRIQLLKLEKNVGVSGARNAALSMCNSKYIAFLDSDDLWDEHKLEKQIEFMKEKDCALSYSRYQIFDSATMKKGRVIEIPSVMKAEDILKNTVIGCLTVMIDAEKAGEFTFPPISHTEDQYAWYSILKKGYLAYGLNETLAFYRVRNGSISGNKIKSVLMQWQFYREVCHFSLIKSMYYLCCYLIHVIKKYYL